MKLPKPRGYLPFFIVIMSLIIMAQLTYGYVMPIDYHGVKLKFYSDKINKSEAIGKLDTIPSPYLEGINTIKFFSKPFKRFRLGQYEYVSKNIRLYGNFTTDTLIHELAHHCQYKKGGKGHDSIFYECYNLLTPPTP